MARNLDLDLNLPTDPGLPPGEEYDEFRKIYNALRQLQDGIAEAAGLVTLTDDDLNGATALALHGLATRAILVFEAVTDITIGQIVQLDYPTNPTKVKQPATVINDPSYNDNAGGMYVGMPLFNCAAGQHVAVGISGAVVPLPGAELGHAYVLNQSRVLSDYYNVVYPAYYHFNTLTSDAGYYLIGYCVEANKLLVNLKGYISYG